MDVLSGKGQDASGSGAWQNTLDMGANGGNLAGLFSLYPSRGDVTISSDTSIATVTDGPMGVMRCSHLTVNAALTASARCRGKVILCDRLTMGAAGSISMTGRGAAGCSKWVNQDIVIPTRLRILGKDTGFRTFRTWLQDNGFAIFDPNLFANPLPGMGDVEANYADWPTYGTTIVDASGCGQGADGGGNGAGVAGGDGTNAPGGGGSGGGGVYTPPGGNGNIWGGGSASGCADVTNVDLSLGLLVDQYGGPAGNALNVAANGAGGGGAGNPGGNGYTTGAYVGSDGEDGTGGLLLVICRGLVTLAAGHVLSANGKNGGGASLGTSNGGGAGSGAGFVGLFYGTLDGTPNLTATGGTAGTSDHAGGNGGDGWTLSRSFAAMGWV